MVTHDNAAMNERDTQSINDLVMAVPFSLNSSNDRMSIHPVLCEDIKTYCNWLLVSNMKISFESNGNRRVCTLMTCRFHTALYFSVDKHPVYSIG